MTKANVLLALAFSVALTLGLARQPGDQPETPPEPMEELRLVIMRISDGVALPDDFDSAMAAITNPSHRAVALDLIAEHRGTGFEAMLLNVLESDPLMNQDDLVRLIHSIERVGGQIATTSLARLATTPPTAMQPESVRCVQDGLFRMDPTLGLETAFARLHARAPVSDQDVEQLQRFVDVTVASGNVPASVFHRGLMLSGLEAENIFTTGLAAPVAPPAPSIDPRVAATYLELAASAATPDAAVFAILLRAHPNPSVAAQAHLVPTDSVERWPWALSPHLLESPRVLRQLAQHVALQDPSTAPFTHVELPALLSIYSSQHGGASSPFVSEWRSDDELFRQMMEARTTESKALLTAIERRFAIHCGPARVLEWIGEAPDGANLRIHNLLRGPAMPPPRQDSAEQRIRNLDAVLSPCRDVLTAALSERLNPDDARQLASTLVEAELSRRAVVLFAALSAQRLLGQDAPLVSFAECDAQLDALITSLASNRPGVKTEVVSAIPATTNSQSGALAMPQGPVRWNVLSRRISLASGQYEETVRLHASDGTSRDLEWAGSIPLWLLPALVDHPRILDVMPFSLAVNDLQMLSPVVTPEMPPALESVARAPTLSVRLLANAAQDPTVPWDVLCTNLSSMGRNTAFGVRQIVEIAVPRPIPLSAELPKCMVDLGLVNNYSYFTTDAFAEFERRLTAISDALMTAHYFDAYSPIARPAIEALPTVLRVPNGSGGWGTMRNREREYALAVIDAAARQTAEARSKFGQWDLSQLQPGDEVQSRCAGMYFRNDLLRMLVITAVGPDGDGQRFVPVIIDIPPAAQLVWKTMRDNFWMLLLPGADPAAITQSGLPGFWVAAARWLAMNDRNAGVARTARRLGVPAVRVSPETHEVLSKSEAGRTLIAASRTWSEMLASVAKNMPMPRQDEDRVANTARVWREQTTRGREKGTADAVALRDAVNRSNSAWSVSLSYSPGLPIPLSVSFSHSQFSLTVSYGPDKGVMLAPQWMGIPSITYVIQTSGTTHSTTAELDRLPTEHLSRRGPAAVVQDAACFASTMDLLRSRGYSQTPSSTPNSLANVLNSLALQDFPIVSPASIAPSVPVTPEYHQWRLRELLVAAVPALTEAERQQLVDRILRKEMDMASIDLLLERSKQANEAARIQSGEWIETSIGSVAPPLTGATDVDPRNGESPAERRDRWFRDQNANASANFRDAVAAYRTKYPNREVLFKEAVPRARLRVERDGTAFMIEYTYTMWDGGLITLQHAQESPFWLVEHLKNDPHGHMLEKLTRGLTDDLSGGAPARGSEGYASRLESLLMPKVTEALNNFMQWLQGEGGSKEGYKTPYVPADGVCGVIVCCLSPALPLKEQWFTVPLRCVEQSVSPLASQVSQGEVVLKAPLP